MEAGTSGRCLTPADRAVLTLPADDQPGRLNRPLTILQSGHGSPFIIYQGFHRLASARTLAEALEIIDDFGDDILPGHHR